MGQSAGGHRDVLLLHAFPAADPRGIRLLASQPRALPPLHRSAPADGLPRVCDLPVLAVGASLVSVPGGARVQLDGGSQAPDRDAPQVFGPELLRLPALPT